MDLESTTLYLNKKHLSVVYDVETSNAAMEENMKQERGQRVNELKTELESENARHELVLVHKSRPRRSKG
jgi:hypothetical protein